MFVQIVVGKVMWNSLLEKDTSAKPAKLLTTGKEIKTTSNLGADNIEAIAVISYKPSNIEECYSIKCLHCFYCEDPRGIFRDHRCSQWFKWMKKIKENKELRERVAKFVGVETHAANELEKYLVHWY